ncbi:aminotransferase class I/II-fold pyridoxal phosphate-dependent enzyme [candidate division KSB1 bacterium]|nr:aminotransferase class I/II-fold pyridoxal phosphate-dependent enzyme [candidate division KSB1 bacterium]
MNKNDLKSLKHGTRMIRAASVIDRPVRSHVPPIYQTVNFEYPDVEEGLDIFQGKKSGYVYTRDGNPTTDLFANMAALLEEGEAGIATASGMAAISNAVLTFVKPGDHIVSSSAIYGGTRTWFRDHLNQFDVRTDFVDITDPDAVKSAITENTRILYTEVVGNPNLVVANIRLLAQIAKQHRILLIVDNTFTPPPIILPLTLGAEIVIHSATKYFGGHGDIIGGVIVSSMPRIKEISVTVSKFGGVMSPFNAWLAIRGLKTLNLRLERHNSNALHIATFLSKHSAINKVFYPGLKSHPFHKIAVSQLNGFGGMLAFEVKGGLDAGKKVLSGVRVCSFTVSLGEIDTLIMHPASTSHIGLSQKERESIGVTDGLIRLSVGIENIEDLLGDLENALSLI